MVSILGDYTYTFPEPIPLKTKLKDLLEDNVDEKYFLSDAMLNYLQSESSGGFSRKDSFERIQEKIEKQGVAATLTTNNGQRATDNFIRITKDTENYIEWEEKGKLDIDCRASKEDKVSTTICTTPKNKVLIKNATKKGYLEAEDGDGIDISSRMQHHRGTVQKGKTQTLTTQCDNGVVVMGNYTPSKHNASRIVDKDYSAPTVMENHGTITATQTSDLRIRKLTPKECFRLMGVKDEDFEKVKVNQSDSSLYHLAGDSICTSCLMAIFGNMLGIDWKDKLNEIDRLNGGEK